VTPPPSPAGIDLNPEPPQAARISKRALIAFVCLVVFFAGALWYGMDSRRKRNEQEAQQRAQAMKVEPASPVEFIRPVVKQELAPPVEPAMPVVQPMPQQIHVMPTPAASPVPTPKEPTAEELAVQRHREAMLSPLYPPRDKDRERETAAPQQTYQPAVGIPQEGMNREPVAEEDEYSLVNFQRKKKVFLDNAAKSRASNYLPYSRTPQVGICEIKAGWEIPAALEQELNSDLPGEIKALVRENVYDTATGRHLLIPQGARLVGQYNSNVGYGQERAQVAWDRIIYPDGSSINLAGMVGMDAQGNAGLKDKVDRHYKRTFGMAILTSALVAAYELTQRRSYGNTGYYIPSAGDRAAGAFGGEMANTAAAVTRRNLMVQPTIKVSAGYRFTVRVNKDMLFEGPYQPQPATEEAVRQPTLRTSR
jgi:type IV secretory pathway VirB10-like protein